MTSESVPTPADSREDTAEQLRADLLRALDRMDSYVGTFEGAPDYSVREVGKLVQYLRDAVLEVETP